MATLKLACDKARLQPDMKLKLGLWKEACEDFPQEADPREGLEVAQKIEEIIREAQTEQDAAIKAKVLGAAMLGAELYRADGCLRAQHVAALGEAAEDEVRLRNRIRIYERACDQYTGPSGRALRRGLEAAQAELKEAARNFGRAPGSPAKASSSAQRSFGGDRQRIRGGKMLRKDSNLTHGRAASDDGSVDYSDDGFDDDDDGSSVASEVDSERGYVDESFEDGQEEGRGSGGGKKSGGGGGFSDLQWGKGSRKKERA